ncbi:hypothetical protein IW150_005517, partial [Coemansia sp. RSA 2607]
LLLSLDNHSTTDGESINKNTSGRTKLSETATKSNSKYCAEIPIPHQFWAIESNQPAFVDISHAGNVNIGESVCVRVVVPPKTLHASAIGDNPQFAPFPSAPWDSILMDLVGNNTGIYVPVRLQPAADIRNSVHESVHIYEADVVMRDVDFFTPQGYIEYRDAMWNPLDTTPAQPLAMEQIVTSSDMVVNVVDVKKTNIYSLSRYLDLPLCTESDVDGRWVNVADLPFDPSVVPERDDYNRVWLPYTCRLRRISYSEFTQCLIDQYPRLHWYGDSNFRRALRKFVTLGQWCSKPEEMNTSTCLCNDNTEVTEHYNINFRDTTIDMNPVTGGFEPTGNLSAPSAMPSDKARINAFRWGGLTTRNDPPWESYFEKNITEHYGVPDVVIIGLINWDAAYSSYEFFVSQVSRLIDRVASSYPDSTEIIIRNGQHYCCTYDSDAYWSRKFSHLRVRYFSQYLIDMFKQRFGGSRTVRLWDVETIGERRSIEARQFVKKCSANHARAEIIEVENQVLMNSMCNSNADP